MSTAHIPVITVSYNSPDLIERLLRTFRQFYANKVYVIDGSNPDIALQIKAIAVSFPNVEFIAFGYNIHHGPGMSWAIQNLGLEGQVLFLDSDVEIVNGGMIESLQSGLTPEMWGAGGIQQVNEQGYDRPEDGAVAYLHPACMLVNIDVVRQWPLPIKHGAPLVQTMLALHQAGKAHLLKHMDWVKDDFGPETGRHYIRHTWQGTVIRTGGYHYDLPAADSTLDQHLLAFVPADAQKLVEVGCHNGVFAKAYRAAHPICNYTGVEADPVQANLARPHCDYVFNLDIEQADEKFYAHVAGADCWILGDVLSSLRDPWAMLARIRRQLKPGGTVVASLRNFQHWSMQARLAVGDLRYQPGTVLDLPDVRVFTRGTILDMFQQAGFRIAGGTPVIREEAGREAFLPALRALAEASGSDPDTAVQDALPWQYIILAQAA
ncbi:methyltransferase domain-containing protein [Pseudoduganella violacea]|uniref:SAM-dependent methyltransferase n=1 Tax=Pseudoduganella violacea TaxID=1715466 RepID=A0A7W5FSU0_9BURK|nr:methyltransferase domain-containing protein [Pseudoduganella violacea]MBB3117533.1 SAM-dependent methyltransferase [Pseudoduganella violacea]